MPNNRIENDEIFSQRNTLLKMAKKRALVDAALSAGRLSDMFTQDMEDIIDLTAETMETKPDFKPHETKAAEAPKAQTTAGSPENHAQAGNTGAKTTGTKAATPAQCKAIAAIIAQYPDVGNITNAIVEEYKVNVFTELTMKQASEIITRLQKGLNK